jgi:hypothetical protein
MQTTLDVEIQTEQGLIPAYCAVPSTPPPWPGVVVIHDFTGMSHDLRAQADWLAGEGFLAVAPDLYYWGTRLSCLRTIMRDLGERRGRTFRRHRGGPPLARESRRVHRQHRSHRVLHGRWLRFGAGTGPRLLGVERQLRRMPIRHTAPTRRRCQDAAPHQTNGLDTDQRRRTLTGDRDHAT